MSTAVSKSYDVMGRTVTMPVEVRDASAGTVMYEVDAAKAQALLPGDAFTVVESSPGKAQLNLALIDYRDNDLGDYNEIGITLFVTPTGGAPETTGTFITHLPVNQEFTCQAGKQIWGFPKSVENITFDYAADHVTATLSMAGQHVLRLTLPRGGQDEMPQMPMTTYTYIDGVAHSTGFSQGGTGSQVLAAPVNGSLRLELGVHPLALQLKELGLPSASPQLVTWTEHMQGTFETPEPV